MSGTKASLRKPDRVPAVATDTDDVRLAMARALKAFLSRVARAVSRC